MVLAAEQVVQAIAERLAAMQVTDLVLDMPPIDEAELPCWEVAAEDESIETVDLGGLCEHTLTVRASGYARQTEGLRTYLNNTLAAEALALLFAAPVPYALELQALRRRLVTVGEAAAGAVDILLQATYFVQPADPETIVS